MLNSELRDFNISDDTDSESEEIDMSIPEKYRKQILLSKERRKTEKRRKKLKMIEKKRKAEKERYWKEMLDDDLVLQRDFMETFE